MSLDEQFQAAVAKINGLTTDPFNDEQKLVVYSHYKQATIGDCNTTRPGFFDMKGKAKWDAWDKLKGKSQDEAKQYYIDYVSKYC